MSAGNRFFFSIPRMFILLLLLAFNNSTGSSRNLTSFCPSSSCGNIRVIRFPFRLKTDPRTCDLNLTYLVLDCQNNRTVMHTSPRSWYYVQEINYTEQTIRLVEPGIKRKNLSSCPLYSNVSSDWLGDYGLLYGVLKINVAVTFVHCLSPIKSSEYVKAPYCGNGNTVFGNISEFYSYIVVGNILVSELEEFCTVDKVIWGPLGMSHNSSLARIYDSLAYGFKLKMCYDLSCPGLQLIFKVAIGFLAAIVVVPLVAWRLVMFVIGFPLLIWLVLHKWRIRHLSMDKTIEDFLQDQQNLTPIKYTYTEIKKMTNKFSQKLGEGGCGIVYKGKLRSGPYVAIKMMEQSMTSEEEFISEVGTIGRIHHVNVVQLIGFCVERSYALVYEFLPNGSLDRYIFNQGSLDVLGMTLEKMFEIVLGVASGIAYLHHGCDMQILHFDIKPHNILLDEKFNPKISDFGLAQLQPISKHYINLTAIRGTIGYMAPEMFYKNLGGICSKADVYSFGMMLMEMVGRRKNVNPFVHETSQIYFPLWAYDQLCAGNDIDVNDATEEEKKTIKKIIIVALWCIQIRPSDRPPINKVITMLEGDSEPSMPPKPFTALHEVAIDHGITRTYSVDYINTD